MDGFFLRLFVAVAGVLSFGCTTDHTSDPEMNALVHRCFQTVELSILYQSACPPLPRDSDGNLKRGLCNSLVYVHHIPFPLTAEAIQGDADNWSERLRKDISESLNSDRITVYGAVPAHTSFEILQIVRWYNGETDSYWLAAATIRDGKYGGTRILLPWGGFPGPYQEHPWITDFWNSTIHAHSRYPVQYDSKSMTPCLEKGAQSTSD